MIWLLFVTLQEQQGHQKAYFKKWINHLNSLVIYSIKGAIITHANVVSIGASIHANVEKTLITEENVQESYISYLPLAHMFERISQVNKIYFKLLKLSY